MQIDNVFKWSTFLNDQHTQSIQSKANRSRLSDSGISNSIDVMLFFFSSSFDRFPLSHRTSFIGSWWFINIKKKCVSAMGISSLTLWFFSVVFECVYSMRTTQPQRKKNTAIFVSSSDISSWIHRMVGPKEIAMRRENKYSEAEKKCWYKSSLSVIVVLILYRARFWFRGDVNGGDLNERERKKKQQHRIN